MSPAAAAFLSIPFLELQDRQLLWVRPVAGAHLREPRDLGAVVRLHVEELGIAAVARHGAGPQLIQPPLVEEQHPVTILLRAGAGERRLARDVAGLVERRDGHKLARVDRRALRGPYDKLDLSLRATVMCRPGQCGCAERKRRAGRADYDACRKRPYRSSVHP